MNYETKKHPSSQSKYLLLDHDTATAQEVTVFGHWLYIRLTERAEVLDGIVLPQKSRDEHTCLYEVMAIGIEVGTLRRKDRKFKGVSEMDCNALLDVKVGDTVLIPEKATGDSSGYSSFIKRSCVSQFEGLIDSGLVLAVITSE